MNIILIGTGRMGRLLKECALDAGDAVVGEYGRANIAELAAAPAADVAIDFSGPEALPAVAAYVARTGTPLVSGTTGYTAGEKAAVAALGEHAPVVWSANYSLGVAVLARALRLVTAALRPDFDIEVTETHHNRKKDAPSGTAKLLVEALDPAGELTPSTAARASAANAVPTKSASTRFAAAPLQARIPYTSSAPTKSSSSRTAPRAAASSCSAPSRPPARSSGSPRASIRSTTFSSTPTEPTR